MAEIAVYCKGVKKVYGDSAVPVLALRGVDLEVRGGELLMIVGPSGSGKTTLISIIAGILDQDEGECQIFGQEWSALTNSQKVHFRAQKVGFVFQAFNLIPMLSSEENVAIPLLLNGVDREEALSCAREILIQFDLKEKLEEFPQNLSGGQQQRVAIARSAVHNPPLIVCDEPTSSLDHETGAKVLTLLRQRVLKEDRAMIIVTHDERIFPFADRIIRLDDGRVVDNHPNHAHS